MTITICRNTYALQLAWWIYSYRCAVGGWAVAPGHYRHADTSQR